MAVTVNEVRYITRGPGGTWARDCIAEGELRVSFDEASQEGPLS